MSTPSLTGAKLKTKSRTGCQECKVKRLKCDETKPHCNQCFRRRRTCPGYRKEFRWSTKYEKALPQGGGSALPSDRVESLAEVLMPAAEWMKPGTITSPPISNAAETVEERQGSNQSEPLSEDLEAWLTVESPSQSVLDLEIPAEGLGDDQDVPIYFGQGDEVEVGDLDEFINSTITGLDNGHAQTEYQRLQDDPPRVPETLLTSLSLRRDTNFLTMSNMTLDMPSLLIKYWFSDVCAMWSAFDSDINPNRQLASQTWSHSPPVYYSLQYMAATCLSDTLPHVRPHVHALAQQAMSAIGQWTASVSPADGSRTLPADLLLSIFAIGTTLSWTDPKQLGTNLLKMAEQIMYEYEMSAQELDQDSKRYLAVFKGSLNYWRMLTKTVTDTLDESAQQQPQPRHDSYQGPAAAENVRLPSDFADNVLHPWTGICGDVHQVFGTVMTLCRRSRLRAQNPNMTAKALRTALEDIEQAQRITQELNDLTFVSVLVCPERLEDGGSPPETNDDKTPVAHFVDIAEAYRLAALVQLYLTFSTDLAPPPLFETKGEDGEGDGEVPLVTFLSLRLVDILARIPPTSGTRCIQPLLYVSAAAGLKYCLGRTSTFITPTFPFSTSICSNHFLIPLPALTETHLQIAKARRAVLDHLSVLQGSLPRRPIAVVVKLSKAIWGDYDQGVGGVGEEGVHWMDTMRRTDLWTLFG